MNLSDLFKAGPYKVDWDRCKKESLPLYLLAEDIKKHGLKDPILLKDGKIEDGIHRMIVLWLMGWKEDIPVKEVK